jgi:Protein of unknown function (DUF3800)
MRIMSGEGQSSAGKRTDGVREFFAYFDESGTHDGAPVIVLGGLLGSAEQFEDLGARLDAVCDHYGFSVFHAVEFKNGKGEFKGWAPEKKLSLAVVFSNLVEETMTAAAMALLVKADYQTIYRADPSNPKVSKDSAYGLCFRMCLVEFLQTIEMVCHYRRTPYVLNVVVEAGARNVQDAGRIFEETRATAAAMMGVDPLGTFQVLGKHECRELMLADFLAYTEYMERTLAATDEPLSQDELAALAALGTPVRKARMFRATLGQEELKGLQQHLGDLKQQRRRAR